MTQLLPWCSWIVATNTKTQRSWRGWGGIDRSLGGHIPYMRTVTWYVHMQQEYYATCFTQDSTIWLIDRPTNRMCQQWLHEKTFTNDGNNQPTGCASSDCLKRRSPMMGTTNQPAYADTHLDIPPTSNLPCASRVLQHICRLWRRRNNTKYWNWEWLQYIIHYYTRGETIRNIRIGNDCSTLHIITHWSFDVPDLINRLELWVNVWKSTIHISIIHAIAFKRLAVSTFKSQ